MACSRPVTTWGSAPRRATAGDRAHVRNTIHATTPTRPGVGGGPGALMGFDAFGKGKSAFLNGPTGRADLPVDLAAQRIRLPVLPVRGERNRADLALRGDRWPGTHAGLFEESLRRPEHGGIPGGVAARTSTGAWDCRSSRDRLAAPAWSKCRFATSTPRSARDSASSFRRSAISPSAAISRSATNLSMACSPSGWRSERLVSIRPLWPRPDLVILSPPPPDSSCPGIPHDDPPLRPYLQSLWLSCSRSAPAPRVARSSRARRCPRRVRPPSQGATSQEPQRHGPLDLAGVAFLPPEAWTDLGASGMRKGAFSFGPVDGDDDAAEVTVFFFGSGQGGDIESNISRWVGQMDPPEGKRSRKSSGDRRPPRRPDSMSTSSRSTASSRGRWAAAR